MNVCEPDVPRKTGFIANAFSNPKRNRILESWYLSEEIGTDINKCDFFQYHMMRCQHLQDLQTLSQ